MATGPRHEGGGGREGEGDDAVFKALADPTRRAILDALFEADGQTVQALCDRFPAMTRFGVMKHLAVLEAANLVSTRRVGRTKLHFHNPVPIQLVADRWISKYARPFTRALADLHDGFANDVVPWAGAAPASIPVAAAPRRRRPSVARPSRTQSPPVAPSDIA